jgi:hypothetical protein
MSVPPPQQPTVARPKRTGAWLAFVVIGLLVVAWNVQTFLLADTRPAAQPAAVAAPAPVDIAPMPVTLPGTAAANPPASAPALVDSAPGAAGRLGAAGSGAAPEAGWIQGADARRWLLRAFSFPPDALSCHGRQLVQYNPRYRLHVGLTFCDRPDEFRVYLSEAADGPFLPATDSGGHGQDQCELVNEHFTLPGSDDIKSGGCRSCDTSRNLPLEDVDTWTRSSLGDPFVFKHTGSWSYQTSRLRCGVRFDDCGFSGRGSWCKPVAADY